MWQMQVTPHRPTATAVVMASNGCWSDPNSPSPAAPRLPPPPHQPPGERRGDLGATSGAHPPGTRVGDGEKRSPERPQLANASNPTPHEPGRTGATVRPA